MTSDEDALRDRILESYKVVCICNKIKKGTIEKAIANGARTLGDIKKVTRAGSGPCGVERGGVTRCTPVLREMLDKVK